MRRVFWLVAAALLLAGCAGEKGIVEKEGYQLDTRRQAQAAYPRIKVLVIHYTADDFDSSLATLTDKQVSSNVSEFSIAVSKHYYFVIKWWAFRAGY